MSRRLVGKDAGKAIRLSFCLYFCPDQCGSELAEWEKYNSSSLQGIGLRAWA